MQRRAAYTLSVLVLSTVLFGCGSSREASRMEALEAELRQSRAQVNNLEGELSTVNQERARYEAGLAEQARLLEQARTEAQLAEERAQTMATPPPASATVSGFASAGQGLDLLPPNAQPGECYARVFTPAQYENRTERILRQEAGERIEVTPARYDTVTERILVQEGGEKLEIVGADGSQPQVRTLGNGVVEVIPTSYETITERVLVKDESERLEVIPARYETRTERVMVKPARRVWRPSRGQIYGSALRNNDGSLITRMDHSRGELMCLVEEPAEYKTVTKRALVQPATTRSVPIPAQYKTVTKRVPREIIIRRIPLEARYENVTRQVLRTPPQERRIEIPAEYDTITQRVQVGEGRLIWMPVLCEVNVTRNTVVEIQRALLREGYNPGGVDGVLGSGTMSAITSFQRSRGLGVGELTIETLDALGVSTNL